MVILDETHCILFWPGYGLKRFDGNLIKPTLVRRCINREYDAYLKKKGDQLTTQEEIDSHVFHATKDYIFWKTVESKKKRTNNKPERLLRLKQVLEIISISRSSWLAGVKRGRYPKPYKIGRRSVAWKESEINALFNRL